MKINQYTTIASWEDFIFIRINMKTIKVAVLGGTVRELPNSPDNATVQYAIERYTAETNIPLNGTFKVGGVEASLDTVIPDAGMVLVAPSERKIAGASEEIVYVTLVERVENKLVDNAVYTTDNTVGELARSVGLSACGTEITLDGQPVGFGDKLVEGTYEVKEVPCGEDVEDSDE